MALAIARRSLAERTSTWDLVFSLSVFVLSREKYIRDLLARAALGDERTVDTPMELNVKLRPTDGDPLRRTKFAISLGGYSRTWNALAARRSREGVELGLALPPGPMAGAGARLGVPRELQHGLLSPRRAATVPCSPASPRAAVPRGLHRRLPPVHRGPLRRGFLLHVGLLPPPLPAPLCFPSRWVDFCCPI
ncbi:hypothetical protein QYE76_069239 [Lolium multiflorum]|uniref:Uncharacterized protein n=1 Tax=Lolium multiflorum TaxID=4521 RepID=A0AAD8SGE0_LOLMU|nr:hypothetical protein QYE76_069239 [Lolium multiflorum]